MLVQKVLVLLVLVLFNLKAVLLVVLHNLQVFNLEMCVEYKYEVA